jgi:hypothetical protein
MLYTSIDAARKEERKPKYLKISARFRLVPTVLK